MLHKKIMTITILAFALLAFAGCTKSKEGTTVAPEATTAQEMTTAEATTSSESTTAVPEQTTQAPGGEATTVEQTTESDKPKVSKVTKGTGKFGGQSDSHSIEIELENGEYMTFFVYDEKLMAKFDNMDIGEAIKFTYGPLKGQINPKLISLDE